MVKKIEDIILFPGSLRGLNNLHHSYQYDLQHQSVNYNLDFCDIKFKDYEKAFKRHILHLGCEGVVNFRVLYHPFLSVVFRGDLIINEKKKK